MTTATNDLAVPVLAGQTQLRGRVCIRAGCGKLLVGNDGRPIYDRNFCGSDCRRADKRERMQEKRRKARKGRCPHCGRKFDLDSSADSSVPRHNGPPAIENPMTQGEDQDGRIVS
jgi:hypothetical protein